MEGFDNHYFTKSMYVIEGFDMVGKTTFMNCLPNCNVYHARHDLTDMTVGRDNSWTIGYGIIDFAEQVNLPYRFSDDSYVIDRGVFSSYVYDRLYNQKYINEKIIDWYKNNEFFKYDIGHIYIRHHDPETARTLFNSSQSREKNPNELSNKYDQFNSFDNYWIFYHNADQLFKEIYKKIGITPRIFETLPNYKWIEVREEW